MVRDGFYECVGCVILVVVSILIGSINGASVSGPALVKAIAFLSVTYLFNTVFGFLHEYTL